MIEIENDGNGNSETTGAVTGAEPNPSPLAENPAQPMPESATSPTSQQTSPTQPETPKFLNMPTTKTLPSGRRIKVNPLPWAGYKKIRSQLLSALSGEVGGAITRAATACEALVKAGQEINLTSVLVSSGILARVPVLITEIEVRIEDLATDLVKACCPEAEAFVDMLHVHDVLALRRIVLDSIDLTALLSAEKNLLRGIFDSVTQTIAASNGTESTTPQA